jgi:hypothetical protein
MSQNKPPDTKLNNSLDKLTPEEQNRFAECFKQKEFRDMFFDYVKEISDPKNLEEYEKMIKDAENLPPDKIMDEINTVKQMANSSSSKSVAKQHALPKASSGPVSSNQKNENKKKPSNSPKSLIKSSEIKPSIIPSTAAPLSQKPTFESSEPIGYPTIPKYRIVHSSEFDMKDYTESRDSDIVRRPKCIKIIFSLPLAVWQIFFFFFYN